MLAWPQNAGNNISEDLNFKNSFRGGGGNVGRGMPPHPAPYFESPSLKSLVLPSSDLFFPLSFVVSVDKIFNRFNLQKFSNVVQFRLCKDK